ncbi:MAG: hypothetical protein E7549_00465 [Ruminococcaceae bacterium]|nr:hypothetical protein [Oscillospiraceae bacterium]
MSIIGFLDKAGNLYPCSSYGHISAADEIVKALKIDKGYRLGEDILLKNGWICIRAGDVYKAVFDGEANILFITPEQQEFFAKHKADFNERQLADIERLSKDFGELYKYRNYKQGDNNG